MKKISLGTILHMTKGKKPKAQASKQEVGYQPYVDIKAFEKGIVDNFASPEKCLLCKDGDILIVCDGARSGLVGKAMTGVVGSTLALISADGCSNNYLFYFLQSLYVLLNTKQKGTGTPHLNPDILKKAQLVVPSQPEQERIVAKIEELFSQLDAAVAELKSVKEKLSIYRQAVLKEAFDFENAKLVEISTIVDNIKIGPFGTMLHKSDYVEGGVPVINPQHIKNNTIVESSVIAISETKAKELENCKLQVNDVIMGRRGEMGRTAPVTMRENGWICGTGSIMIRLKKEYDATLYSKILASPQVVHFLEKMAKGTTMKNLNEKIVARIPVPKITRDIQDSILSNTSRKMSICDNIEQTVDTALQRAAAFRQSILKQAFEGKL